MGCCNNGNFKMDEEALKTSIKQSIRQNAIRRLDFLLKYQIASTGKPLSINESRFLVGDKMSLNTPAYAILTGNLEVFQFLTKNYIISIEKINEIFDKYHTNAISVICLNGYSDFLKYFLPICLEFNTIDKTLNEIYTLNLSDTHQTPNAQAYTPIQLACLNGHLDCVNIILSYFKDKKAPWWLDLNYTDPVWGENCALVACKSGQFIMIKYLFSYTNAKFNVLNSNNENALQVFLSAAKLLGIVDQISVVKFLVEEVKIDIHHQVEETLLICECNETLKYLEGKFKELGIEVSKEQLEKENQIRARPRSPSLRKTILMERSMASTIRDLDQTYSLSIYF